MKLKCPVASSVRLRAAPPSMRMAALATPDRLSSTWPLTVRLVLMAAGVATTTILGACTSCVSANLASTACATCSPIVLPARLSDIVWMPP